MNNLLSPFLFLAAVAGVSGALGLMEKFFGLKKARARRISQKGEEGNKEEDQEEEPEVGLKRLKSREGKKWRDFESSLSFKLSAIEAVIKSEEIDEMEKCLQIEVLLSNELTKYFD